MAALLRSARLLKFSPSGLLQTTGIKRTGPSLGRLYSGALGGRRTGGCSRQISPVSENASSLVWPYAVGCVRNYAVATQQKNEDGSAVRSKQMQQFDWALVKLDSSVRRTGRITKTLLLNIFHDLCRTGYPSGNQALLLLRSCGSLLPEVLPEERTELAHRVWDKLQELGAQYDVSHYNAMLKVYLQNDFKFSPTDFLAKMETAQVQPNRVTYQRLIAAYGQKGDMEGASTILGFMKSKDLPITEAVFSSLVTGHARAGDMESAKNILPVMRGAGMEPTPDTYVALLSAYAEKGDLDSMKETLEEAESADCRLMDRDIMQIIFALAKAGHQQHVPQFIERLRHEIGYVPDAMNLCLSLVTHGQDETAFKILKTFRLSQADTNNASNLGNFFLRHCVNMDLSPEKIVSYCKDLQENNLHAAPLSFTLSCALEAKKTDTSLELMRLMKEQDFPIRPHYFWPILNHHVKENNVPAALKVVKGMQELGVSSVVETLCAQVLRFFPNIEAAQQAFKDAGISLGSEDLLYTEMYFLALNNLGELYTRLSDPALSSLDLKPIRNGLIAGFKKSKDVESMVKIVELLRKTERFANTDNHGDGVSYFLYSLIDSMPARQVQAQEDKLHNFFTQLKAQNVTISSPIFKGIRNILQSHKTPKLIKDVRALDVKDGVSKEPEPAAFHVAGKLEELERQLAQLKAENKPVGTVLKSLIQILSVGDNLQRALELKQQHEEELTVGSYVSLISLCCRHNNVEEALNLKREMSRKDLSVTLTPSKYLQLVKALSMNDKEEEAVDILKEMKEKEVVLSDADVTLLFHLLNAVAEKDAIPTVQRLLDTVFTLGLAKLTSNLCSPVISAYLQRKDVSSALDAALDYQKRYNVLPRMYDIIVELVEKGDAELLQKALDFVGHKRGDMNMLYTLFFAFVQTGRYREAQKIIETPGFRARNGHLQWFSEKCISNNQMQALEQLVGMTAKLFGCDRDEMYSYLLRLCKETNNWKKAEAVWTKMQEENVIPRERTLRLLADILKSNGQEVPFEVPEIWYENIDTTQQGPAASEPTTTPTKNTNYHGRLLTLVRKRKTEEACKLLEEAEKKGVALGPTTYDQLIRTLLSMGSLEDALAVRDIAESHIPDFKLSNIAFNLLIITYGVKGQIKDGLEKLRYMIELEHVPSHLCITKLVNAMGQQGDTAGIQEVESLITGLGTDFNLSRMVFVNNMAIAHIKKGDVESAVELLEGLYTNPGATAPSLSFVCKKVLEDGNEHALDKLSVMVERLANHFACYKPACDLFLQLLDMDKVEDAKFMLARCNAVAEQTPVLLSYVSKRARRPGQVGKIKNLLSLIPDCIEKELAFAYIMKCHTLDNDLPSAKALYEQMQKEGMAINELSLKRLAALYQKAGETVPFTEPPESYKFYADKLKSKNAKAPATDEE